MSGERGFLTPCIQIMSSKGKDSKEEQSTGNKRIFPAVPTQILQRSQCQAATVSSASWGAVDSPCRQVLRSVKVGLKFGLVLGFFFVQEIGGREQ